MSATQYLRKMKIALAGASGDGLDFSDFKCTFRVRRGDYQNPNSCDLTIYNLADTTANRIQNEFTQMEIQAGYEGNYGLIFRGTIKQVRKGRLQQKDSYVAVTAADGDEAYNFSTMSVSIAAGTQPADAVSAFLSSMAKFGITQGYVPKLPQNGNVRGRVYFGMTKEELRGFATNYNCAWSIQDGALTLIPLTSYAPGPIPLLSSTTGLIGVPEQTQNGIHIKLLLNPSIRIGQLVKLDNAAAVNRYRYGLDIQSQAANQLLSTSIKTNADGLYYVMVANHSGDTRGNEWYTDLICLAVDATIPFSALAQTAVAPESAAIKMN